MASDRITLLVTDDHPIMRDGIIASIQRQPDMELVAEAGNGLEALEQFRIHKGLIRQDLLSTIRAVVNGKRVIDPEVVPDIVQHYDDDSISEREALVLSYVSRGKSNREIANILSLKEDTVKGTMRQIMAKLRAHDRTHAVMIALERGILGS